VRLRQPWSPSRASHGYRIWSGLGCFRSPRRGTTAPAAGSQAGSNTSKPRRCIGKIGEVPSFADTASARPLVTTQMSPNSKDPIQTCENCGVAMQIVRVDNPGKARCPGCGHEVDFLSDPPAPEDPYGDADGLLIVESFNGREKQAALVLRQTLGLTPKASLDLVRDASPRVFWPWSRGLWGLFDLKDRLNSLGVSSRIERIRGR
jgi:hypothetical protein